MSPRDALEDGRLEEAVAIQSAIVESDPGDSAALLFLAELLTLAGRVADAREQFVRIRSDSNEWRAARRVFLQLLQSIRRRGRRPMMLGDTIPEHVRRRWKIVLAHGAGNTRAAAGQMDRADMISPTMNGHVDGREFDGLRDADDRFASVLELFVGGRYCWLQFECITRITLSPATTLLDVAYRPAQIRTTVKNELNVLLPLLYPDSHTADGDFAMGRDTDWADAGGLAVGVGAKVMLAGDEELRLGDCRQFEFFPST